MIFEKRNVVDSAEHRKCFEKEAADVLIRHYQQPIAILFSWQPGEKPDTIDLRATPQVFDDLHHRI